MGAVRLGCLLVAGALAPAHAASAQQSMTIDQVPQRAPAGAASAFPQVGHAPSKDRVGIVQLPGTLAERPAAQAESAPLIDGVAASARQVYALTAQGRGAGSVDAEEIARLLDRGEAASIDAAAAIATGAAAQESGTAVAIDDAEAMRRRLIDALAALPQR